MTDRVWKKVVFANDCLACEDCGEPLCTECNTHYADCTCPGPTQDDEYDYEERPTEDGPVMYAAVKE